MKNDIELENALLPAMGIHIWRSFSDESSTIRTFCIGCLGGRAPDGTLCGTGTACPGQPTTRTHDHLYSNKWKTCSLEQAYKDWGHCEDTIKAAYEKARSERSGS